MSQTLTQSKYEVLAETPALRLIKIHGDEVAFIELDDLVPFHLEELQELLGRATDAGFKPPLGGLLIEEAWLFEDGFGDRIVLV